MSSSIVGGVFERLGRYEAMLWRQVRQIIFTLESLRWRVSRGAIHEGSILGTDRKPVDVVLRSRAIAFKFSKCREPLATPPLPQSPSGSNEHKSF